LGKEVDEPKGRDIKLKRRLTKKKRNLKNLKKKRNINQKEEKSKKFLRIYTQINTPMYI